MDKRSWADTPALGAEVALSASHPPEETAQPHPVPCLSAGIALMQAGQIADWGNHH